MAIVSVIGTGTIGRPLITLLADHKNELGIDEVWFHKRTPLKKEKGKVERLTASGARLIVDEDKVKDFKALGHKPYATHNDLLAESHVIIDCTPKGDTQKDAYELVLRIRRGGSNPIKGFIAQGGSKETFGKNYAYTINDRALMADADRFIRVVSCNTHQLVVILNTLVLTREGVENLEDADFVIQRRASDISQDESIGGIEVAEPSHGEWGSHQGYDAGLVFKTFIPDFPCIINAQVTKDPNQYMHVAHFTLRLKRPITLEEVKNRFRANPLVAFTDQMTNNQVFSEARDSSDIHGRILNQTVLLERSLQVLRGGTKVKGTCFTPQDGNALLSSIAATLWLLDAKTYKEKMKVFDKFLFDEI